MVSKKHSDLEKRLELSLSKKGRVLGFTQRVRPDLVLILKTGQIIAVEVEMSDAGAWDIKKNRKLYSDYDEIWIYRLKPKTPYVYEFKAKRYYSKKFFENVLKMTKEGKKQVEIIKELEKELGRKEKALAEAAALLVLKKKPRISGGTERPKNKRRRPQEVYGFGEGSGGKWSQA